MLFQLVFVSYSMPKVITEGGYRLADPRCRRGSRTTRIQTVKSHKQQGRSRNSSPPRCDEQTQRCTASTVEFSAGCVCWRVLYTTGLRCRQTQSDVSASRINAIQLWWEHGRHNAVCTRQESVKCTLLSLPRDLWFPLVLCKGPFLSSLATELRVNNKEGA